MTRAEVIYRLLNRGYSTIDIANAFDLSKQRIFVIRWKYYHRNKQEVLETCDLCWQRKSDTKPRMQYRKKQLRYRSTTPKLRLCDMCNQEVMIAIKKKGTRSEGGSKNALL